MLFGKTHAEKQAIRNKKLLKMKNGVECFTRGFPVKLADGRWLFWGRYFAYYMVSQSDDGNYHPVYNLNFIRRLYLDRNDDHIINVFEEFK